MELKFKLNDPVQAREYFERKMAYTTGPAELKYFLDKGKAPNIIDVRMAEHYAEGHVPGALSLPEDSWQTLRGLAKDRLNVVYCYSGVCHLAARACVHFASHGYPVMEMDGGYDAWVDYYAEDIEKGASGRLVA